MEALSFDYCCNGKAVSIIYSECVSLGLVIQHAMLVQHIVLCGLSSCTIFFHIIINNTIFGKKTLFNTKVCF